MAESKSVAFVPLSGSNYPTWKVQCRMALMKEGLWGIVNGTERSPPEGEAEKLAKFVARRDRALAIVVLSVNPTLLYLLGDPEDPIAVWKKLSDQFQKKSWANKLELRRRLYSLRLKEGDPVQEHIRQMTEIFEELAVIGDPLKEENRVVYLLASLPESFSMLVTALETNADVPQMEVVIERLLHEERKQKDREDDRSHSKAMATAVHPRRSVKCYHCGKVGHIKPKCPLLVNDEKTFHRRKEGQHKANKVSGKLKSSCNSDSENEALMFGPTLAKAVRGMTPFEAWTKMKPSVGHLRVFGSDAYAHVPKEERRKLDSKAKKCIFVGYGNETKGYRLYDPTRARIIFSRDVLFKEMCGTESTESEGEQYVQFDLSSDEASLESGSEQEPAESAAQPPVPVARRSVREKQFPDYYGRSANIVAKSDPNTVEEEKDHWINAMTKEKESLDTNCVWNLVELPEGRKPVGSKWVFKTKTNADGKIERYKARLVAQVFSQKFGSDYDETFCPVVRLESVRTLIAMSVQYGLQLHQVDVTTAFLNGELKEEVYMRQPEGFVTPGKEHLVCKLKKSIYGLKQSPRCWNTALDSHLKKMGFVSDPCIYRAASGESFLLGVYVDDIVLASKSSARLEEVKRALAKKFDIKDMGKLHHFLGMKIVQDKATGKVWIGQPAYTESLLQKFEMETAKAVATPVDTGTKLMKAIDEECFDQRLYQSAIGSLLYLSVATRPDIAFAVSSAAKFSANPTKQHWTAVKRIMRYLRGTTNLGLAFFPQVSGKCVGYCDADWGGDLDDRKSTSGYLFQVGGAAVSWRSKKQTCVALSTAEAEYVALASAAQEAVWMGQLTTELGIEPEAITIFEDNQSAISMTKNPQFHGRAKHIDLKYHFVRDQVSEGTVKLEYCPSKEMIADMLTKGLPKDQFVKLRQLAGLEQFSGCE